MSPTPTGSNVNVEAIKEVLANAKMHLDDALNQVAGGAGDEAVSAARAALAADTNSGCNTSCGRSRAQRAQQVQ